VLPGSEVAVALGDGTLVGAVLVVPGVGVLVRGMEDDALGPGSVPPWVHAPSISTPAALSAATDRVDRRRSPI